MTSPYLFYENGQYVIAVTNNVTAATINMYIWYGSRLDNLTKKTITFTSDGTSIHPSTYINYYNGNYYLLFRDMFQMYGKPITSNLQPLADLLSLKIIQLTSTDSSFQIICIARDH